MLSHHRLVLIDFGSAWSDDLEEIGIDPDTDKNRHCGTEGYYDPEIFHKDHINPMLIDVFSIGILLLEMLTKTHYDDPKSWTEQIMQSHGQLYQILHETSGNADMIIPFVHGIFTCLQNPWTMETVAHELTNLCSK